MKRLAPLYSSLLALALACGDKVTGPATRELALSVCPTNSWVAFQNEGGPWTRLGGSTGGDVTIRATERLALAVSSITAEPPVLFLYFIGADQARGVLDCYEPDPFEMRSLSGTVQGITLAKYAQLSIGRTFWPLDLSSDTFTFWYATAGTRDLFATRHTEIVEGVHVDRMIIRRAQAHTNGTIPLLDFESNEAILPAQNVLSWTASGGNARVQFRGADGNLHVMQLFDVGAWGAATMPWSLPLYSVPANRLVVGDLHVVNLYNEDRAVTAHYHQPADMTLTLGPALIDPTFTTIATTPSLRVHATFPWQPEYDGHLTMELRQSSLPGPRVVKITFTREHFLSAATSAPAAWDATIPDLSGVADVPSGLGLVAGTPFDWTLSATSRRWDAPTVGAPGDVYRYATRYGTSGN